MRLYSVASDFEAVATLELPGMHEGRHFIVVAFNPAGNKLAVAISHEGDTAAPLVAVFSGENGGQDPPLQLGAPVAGDSLAFSVCFSNDGRFLCAGFSSNFAIWDHTRRRACASSSARTVLEPRAPSARRTTC